MWLRRPLTSCIAPAPHPRSPGPLKSRFHDPQDRRPALKRAFDILLTLLAGLALSPVLLAIALAVRLSSPGPAVHWSQRVEIGRASCRERV